MLKKYSAISFSLCIALFVITAMAPKGITQAHSVADSVSVNIFKLRFTKENGKSLNFRTGESLTSFSNITISVNKPYILAKVDVILVRGKRPVYLQTYSGTQQEIIIDKEFITKHSAQSGDRILVELTSVTIQKNGQDIPVELDVPVFNIPLN